MAEVNGANGTARTQEISSDVGDCRGEIGIVRATLDDRLSLGKRLIFPVQVECLDRC
jgi:hypothetical protein